MDFKRERCGGEHGCWSFILPAAILTEDFVKNHKRKKNNLRLVLFPTAMVYSTQVKSY